MGWFVPNTFPQFIEEMLPQWISWQNVNNLIHFECKFTYTSLIPHSSIDVQGLSKLRDKWYSEAGWISVWISILYLQFWFAKQMFVSAQDVLRHHSKNYEIEESHACFLYLCSTTSESIGFWVTLSITKCTITRKDAIHTAGVGTHQRTNLNETPLNGSKLEHHRSGSARAGMRVSLQSSDSRRDLFAVCVVATAPLLLLLSKRRNK